MLAAQGESAWSPSLPHLCAPAQRAMTQAGAMGCDEGGWSISSSYLDLAGTGWLLYLLLQVEGKWRTGGEGCPAGTEAHGVCIGVLCLCSRAAWPWGRGQCAADPTVPLQGAPGTTAPSSAPSNAVFLPLLRFSQSCTKCYIRYSSRPCLLPVCFPFPYSAPPALHLLPREIMYTLGCLCSLYSASYLVP